MISVIHATRRGAKALAVREDYIRKAVREVQYIFVADVDDEATVNALHDHNVIVGPSEGAAAAYNLGALAATGDVLVVAADDVVPPECWDELVLERLGDVSQPRVLAVSDGNRKDRLLTHPILTRARWEQQGRVIFQPGLGLFSDRWFTESAYEDGVVIEARDLTFEHRHPSFGKGEWDAIYRRANTHEEWQEGLAEFRKRWPDVEVK